MADFNIVIKVNSGPAIAGTKQVSNSFTNLQRQAQQLQRVLTQTFGVFAGGAAVAGAIRVLADFGQRMSQVQAVTRASDETMQAMRKSALEMGLTTRFTATQAAEGMALLAKAGFSTSQVMEALDGTMLLALAGEMQLGEAADVTTSILRGFGQATSQTSHIVDVLAMAANSSNTDVKEIGQAMKFVAPIAAGMNVSLEDTTAALEVLSNAGLKASMAGTGLRRVLSALEAPTNAETNILNAMGIKAEEVRISHVGLIGALERLREAGITTGEAIRLFGQRGGPAFSVMVKQIPLIKEFTEENKNADGTAKDFAETMDRNLNGALLHVKSAMQGAVVAFGELGHEAALTKFVEGIATGLRFAARHAQDFERALIAVGIALAVHFYQRGLILATKGVNALTAAIQRNPATTWLTIITALVVAFTLFSDQIKLGSDNLATMSDFLTAISDTLGDTFTAAITNITDLFKGLFGIVDEGSLHAKKSTESFGSTFGLVFLTALKTVAQVVDKLLGTIFGLISAIINGFGALPGAVADIFIQMMNNIIEETEKGINFWVQGLNKIPGVEMGLVDFKGLENKFAGKAFTLGQVVKDTFLQGWNSTVVQDALAKTLDKAEAAALERMILAQMEAGGVPAPMSGEDKAPRTGDRGRRRKSFTDLLNEIRTETALLKLSSKEYEIQGGLVDMQDQLKRKLTITERVLATVALTNLQHQRNLTDTYQSIIGPIEDLKTEQASLMELWLRGEISLTQYRTGLIKVQEALLQIQDPRAFAVLQRQKDLYNEIKSPMREYALTLAALTQLEKDHMISVEEKNRKLQDAKIQMLEGSTGENAGMERGLLKIKRDVEDVASVIDNSLTNAFQGAEDALVSFVTTGKADFSGLITSMLGDLTRLLARQMLFSLIPGMNVPGGLKFAGGGSFIVGGPPGVDRTPVSFTASRGEQVTVSTPDQQKAQSSSTNVQVPVKVVNVFDPNEVTKEMNSSAGERVILNVISRNRNAVKGSIAS